MNRYYDLLKSTYPEHISLNQMYQICRISKATARYLVHNSIIPCVENPNNKTWRYTIKLDDVIDYLKKKEQQGSMIPKGAVKKRPSKKQPKIEPLILKDDKNKVEAYFNSIYSSYPDVVTTKQASAMTGIHKTSIARIIKKGSLKAINHAQKYSIPKKWLIEFTISEEYLNYRSYSDEFKNIINGYETWKKK